MKKNHFYNVPKKTDGWRNPDFSLWCFFHLFLPSIFSFFSSYMKDISIFLILQLQICTSLKLTLQNISAKLYMKISIFYFVCNLNVHLYPFFKKISLMYWWHSEILLGLHYGCVQGIWFYWLLLCCNMKRLEEKGKTPVFLNSCIHYVPFLIKKWMRNKKTQWLNLLSQKDLTSQCFRTTLKFDSYPHDQSVSVLRTESTENWKH